MRTARELGTENAGDDEHLALAYQREWVFVTHNTRDFELLHNAWLRWSELWGVQVTHGGILVLEPVPSPQRLAAVIEERLAPGARIVGEFAIWRSLGGWSP